MRRPGSTNVISTTSIFLKIPKLKFASNSAVKIKPLTDTLGVEISGVSLSQDLNHALVAEIVSLLYEHAVVCIRDQILQPDELQQFGSCLGEPVQHNEKDLWLDGLPGVMSLSNADDRDDRQLNGGAHWHTDLVHTEEPASFTMLHAVAVPASGGGTLFANQLAAYQALSAEMKNAIDGLIVIHCYEGRTDGSMPEIPHPLVRAHPVSGKKVLYGAADTGIGIKGMPRKKAMRLYADIGEHATRAEFVYRHNYRLNDVVVWDNAQLLHSAEILQRASSKADQRIMHRVSVRGWP